MGTGGAGVPLDAAAGGSGWFGSAAGGLGSTAGAGAVGGASAAPAGGMAMEGGWQMPAVTGGAQSLYAGPAATGEMNPGAPASNAFWNNPKFYNALSQFAASMGQGRGEPAAAAPAIRSGPAGQWQPPAQMRGPGGPGGLPGYAVPGVDVQAMQGLPQGGYPLVQPRAVAAGMIGPGRYPFWGSR